MAQTGSKKGSKKTKFGKTWHSKTGVFFTFSFSLKLEKWETWGKYEKIKIEKSCPGMPRFIQNPIFWVFYPILPNISLTFEGQAIFKKSPMAVFMYPIEQIRLRIQFWFICIGQIMIWSHLGSVSKKIEDFWKKNENPNYQFCLGKTKKPNSKVWKS